MKPRSIRLVMSIVLSALPALSFAAGPQASGLVDEEYRVTQDEFRRNIIEQKKQIRDLTEQYRKTVETAQRQGAQIGRWIEDLRRYDNLLTARYVDEKGEPLASLAISDRDRDNINTLCASYLQDTRPLSGRVSAGHARKTIEVAMERLKDLQKSFLEPSEKNHPELEIIAHQKSEAEKKMERLFEIARRSGLNLAADPGARVPASVPASR